MKEYARFYALLKQLPYTGDRKELKDTIVRQYTWDRTSHLREMSQEEYLTACRSMERMIPGYEENKRNAMSELRHMRSCCLKQMQRMGIDTSNWMHVNAFCLDNRIAGQVFAAISEEGLSALLKKLRSMERKGYEAHPQSDKRVSSVSTLMIMRSNENEIEN